MKQFLAIVRNTGATVDKVADFDTQAEADNHVLTYEGFVVSNPGGGPKYWVVDEEAQTVTNDQAQADADALADSWASLRTERNALLGETDFYANSDVTMPDDMKVYRQALRDLPASYDNSSVISTITWPTKP